MKKLTLTALTLTLLVVACGEEEGVTPPNADYRLVPTSPRAVLVNVETAFNRRDINLLKAMLSESFVFYFDPDDVGQNPPGSHYIIPESWSYTEIIRAVENLFRQAHTISMTIDSGQVGAPGREATTFKAENVNGQLLVMIDEVNGYLAEDSCNFAFEKYRSEGGADYWRLIKWWDNGPYYADTRAEAKPTSIGKILSLYR